MRGKSEGLSPPRAGTGGAWWCAFALVVLASTQGPGAAIAQQVPRLPVGRDELVRIEDHRERRILEYVIGPVRLEVGAVERPLQVQLVEFPIAGWLHGFDLSLRDSVGSRLPLELLSHVRFIDPDQRELFTPIPRRILAAAPDAAQQRLPGLFGYPIQPGDRFLISVAFSNPTGEDLTDVWLHVAFDYSLEGEKLIEPRNVYPFHLDVLGPVGAMRFEVPPGRSKRAWQGSPAVPGRILALGGHVHDFATRLRLVDVTAGTVLWDVEPRTDREGQVAEVPRSEMWWRLGRNIFPDRIYRIEVEYDNPLREAAPEGGMGEIGGVILVEKGLAWPILDTADPIYAADLQTTLTMPGRTESGRQVP